MKGRQTSPAEEPNVAGPQVAVRTALQPGLYLGDFLSGSVLHTTDVTFILRRRMGALLVLEV